MFQGNIDTDLPLNLTGDLVDQTNDSDDVVEVSNKKLTISVHIVSNKDGSWSKWRLPFVTINLKFMGTT